MTLLKKFSTLTLLFLLFFSSCTIQKRVHMKGYLVEWNKSIPSTKKNLKVDDLTTKKTSIAKEESILVEKKEIFSTKITKNIFPNSIITKIRKKEKKVTLNQESIKSPNLIEKENQESVVLTKTKKKVSNSEDESSEGSGKSQIVALILVLLVGALGIHRFYLGHIGIGILMLLTGGLCGILLLIDLIRIITGDLKPKGGDYSETF